MALAEWIWKNRYTRREAAEVLGVTERTIGNWKHKEPELLKLYLEMEQLYLKSLILNKSFKIKRLSRRSIHYGVYVWGEKDGEHNDWVLWRVLPKEVLKKMGLKQIRNKRRKVDVRCID